MLTLVHAATDWVREIRKLTERGHQSAIIATDYRSTPVPLAVAMFSRWSQESFFKYAREHYNVDRLVDYRTEAISYPLQVVNLDHRRLDGQVRSGTGKRNRRLVQFGAMNMEEAIDTEPVESFLHRKADLQGEIKHLQNDIQTLKEERKGTARHITVDELPKEERFQQLSTPSKY